MMIELLVAVGVVVFGGALFWGFEQLSAAVTRDGSNPADLVVLDADIFTSDAENPRAGAVAVKDERFCYVGDEEGVADYVGPETRVINAGGKMLTPGFIDNHCHVLWMGAMQALMTSVYGLNSLEEVKAAVNEYAAANPENPFVIGIGWRYDYIPGGLPDLALADSIIADRPLFMWSYDGHTGWVNSMALERMQSRNPEAFAELTPELDEATGEPTGVLLHFYAFSPLDYFSEDEIAPDVEQKMFDAITATLDEGLKCGVTSFHDVQIYDSFVPMLLKFKQQGGLDRARARGSYYIGHYALEDEAGLRQELEGFIRLGEEQSDDHLRLGDSVKLYIEGVCQNHTALLFEPYSDEPDNYGHALWTQQDFDRVIEIVDGMRLQACTHGTGDAGINRVINAYESARRTNAAWDSRHRVDHCEMPIPADQRRMAELGLHAAMQPCHFFGDATGEAVFGPERLQRFMPWRSLQEAGVRVSFGSDWCAGPINPIYGMLIAGTRMNYKGSTDWGPDQAVRIEDALRHYTIHSAEALKMEDDIGSIEVGKYADFAIFSINLLGITSWWFLLTHKLELGALDDFVEMTVVGGRTVYEKPDCQLWVS